MLHGLSKSVRTGAYRVFGQVYCQIYADDLCILIYDLGQNAHYLLSEIIGQNAHKDVNI